MTQFCALFLGIYALLAPQTGGGGGGGGAWHNTPLNTSLTGTEGGVGQC